MFFCRWLVTLKQHCNVDILRVNPGSNLLVWLCILASAGNSFCCKEYFFCLSVNFLVNISWQCNCNGRFSRTMWCDEFFWRSTISKDVFNGFSNFEEHGIKFFDNLHKCRWLNSPMPKKITSPASVVENGELGMTTFVLDSNGRRSRKWLLINTNPSQT